MQSTPHSKVLCVYIVCDLREGGEEGVRVVQLSSQAFAVSSPPLSMYMCIYVHVYVMAAAGDYTHSGRLEHRSMI